MNLLGFMKIQMFYTKVQLFKVVTDTTIYKNSPWIDLRVYKLIGGFNVKKKDIFRQVLSSK